jgi:hypothetical protein
MTDVVKTRNDLKTEAFGILVGLDPAQTPEAEDLATIDTYVDPLLAQLDRDEIVHIPDANEIPVEFFLPLVRLLANNAGPRFGQPMSEQVKMADERTLRILAASRPTYEPMEGQYF